MRNAIVLLSGGLDSYTCAVIAKSQGFELYAMSVFYNQRHKLEIEYAKKIVSAIGAKDHLILDLDIFKFIGKSALTSNIDVPENRTQKEMETDIPVTYVPARNTIFLSNALAWAEVLPSKDIFIGVNALDYSGYPDCRPEFISAFEKMANLATKAGVEGNNFKIHTPLINLKKSEIIKKGIELGCDYSLTISCYQPDEYGRACAKCDSCLLRKKGFSEAGVPDPTIYR